MVEGELFSVSWHAQLISELKSEEYHTVAILGHTSIDPDSIAAAFAVAFVVEQLQPTATIDVLVDGISPHTTKLLDFYQKDFLTETTKTYDLIIIVDVNVLVQLGKFKALVEQQEQKKVIIIDHHTPSELSEQIARAFIDEHKSSTAEMVSEIILTLALKPPVDLLTILLAGIIYDSRRFYSLNLDLLQTTSELIKLGGDYNQAVSLLQKPLESPEKIARLKCAARLQIEKFGDWLIVWSRVGSYEGSAARGILDLGADVALIFTKRKSLTRLTVRANSSFYHQTGINFGSDIMRPLGLLFNGDGGGHSTAAALTIEAEIPENELKKETFKLLRKCLK